MLLAKFIEKGDEVEATRLFDALFESFDLAFGDFKTALKLCDLSELLDEFLVVAFLAFEATADHEVADIQDKKQTDDADDQSKNAITRGLLFEVSGDLVNLFFKEGHDACVPCGLAVEGAAEAEFVFVFFASGALNHAVGHLGEAFVFFEILLDLRSRSVRISFAFEFKVSEIDAEAGDLDLELFVFGEARDAVVDLKEHIVGANGGDDGLFARPFGLLDLFEHDIDAAGGIGYRLSEDLLAAALDFFLKLTVFFGECVKSRKDGGKQQHK